MPSFAFIIETLLWNKIWARIILNRVEMCYMCLLLIRTNPWSFLVSSFFSFAIWRFHDYFNPNIEVQRHHTLHIYLEVRIWYLEQLKKGDFNSAILSRQEPIINQQATDATKLEMERKKLEKHSFVLRFYVKRHLLLNL